MSAIKEKSTKRIKSREEINEIEREMAQLSKRLRIIQEEDQKAMEADDSDSSIDSIEKTNDKENIEYEKTDVDQISTVDKSNDINALNFDELTNFMGNHPDSIKPGDAALLQEVADRIKVWIKEGIQKDERLEILKLVPTKSKDCNMSAPVLNEEIKSNIRAELVKKDKYFYNYQQLIGSSLSLTASALSMVLNDQNDPIDRDELLQCLSDAVKLNADLFHSMMITRKIFITPSFDPKVKVALDKIEPTEFLFGDNIKEVINNVKTVESVGKTLKSSSSSQVLKSNNSLNWKRSSGKEANQTNRKQGYYYASRTARQNYGRSGPQKNYAQKNYAQTQPMKFKKRQ